MSAADDPRQAALTAPGMLADIVFPAPDAWPHALRGTGEKSVSAGEDSLSERYCTLAGHRFLRARLVLPIQDRRETLGVETWASISEATWTAVLGARTGGPGFDGGFAWLANALAGFGPEPIGCNLLPARPGELPRLFAQQGPLAEAQKAGLDLDHLTALLAAAGRQI